MNFAEIEEKWNRYWEEQGTYKAYNQSQKPKYYVLDMFPYPSGAGLHVGHPLGYIASDIYARVKRMEGYNVLHPMGFDAFGLPAEQYAVETGVHPAESTEQNIQRFKKQLRKIGLSFDWSREIRTCDPRYYKWTQWIFLRLFEHYYDLDADKALPITRLIEIFETNGSHGVNAFHAPHLPFTAEQWKSFSARQKSDVLMHYRLAYRKKSYVNWCEELGTVLANDEVRDGVSERGGYPVVRKPMVQWFLRITAYAERLLAGLDKLDWSDSLKSLQRNWIGKSTGAIIHFPVVGSDFQIDIFTTRPDTLFGATFMVLAPEHELIDKITPPEKKAEVEQYLEYVRTRTELERRAETRKITGVFTGAYAVHPFTGQQLPIWISEYVLPDYGTGAIMAVPSRDDRDHAFAQHFQLPIVEVIDQSAYPEATREDKVGVMINSDFLNGLEVPQAIERMIEELEKRGLGRRAVSYKLRDANFSRQRYWGEPFPIVYDPEGVPHPLPDSELPLELPPLRDFKPSKDGKSPLSKLTEWVELPNGWRRETDTMPGFAGSSWYFLRFMDPHNDREPFSQQAVEYWRSVDLYVGGAEHAVGHLMYARFWNMFLYDLGLVPEDEPFKKLINQGMIQGIIEHIFMLKTPTDDGRRQFVSYELVQQGHYDEEELVKIPVDIRFVKNYGNPDSYLDVEGIGAFTKWRPEYANALFRTPQGYYCEGKLYDIDNAEDFRFYTYSEVGKMSKSKYNTINPDDVIAQYGADCFRMYEMFLGPIEQSKPWNMQGIDGISKFLKRYIALFIDKDDRLRVQDVHPTTQELKILHRTIKKVREDVERFSYNTAISFLMMAVGELRKLRTTSRQILEPLNRLMAPFAPYITEEIHHRLGHDQSVHLSPLPEYDPSQIVEATVEYPLCINGKKRGVLILEADMSPDEIEKQALASEIAQKWTAGKQVKKVIVVPKRMINLVVQ